MWPDFVKEGKFQHRPEVMTNSVEIKFGSNSLLDDSCLFLFR